MLSLDSTRSIQMQMLASRAMRQKTATRDASIPEMESPLTRAATAAELSMKMITRFQDSSILHAQRGDTGAKSSVPKMWPVSSNLRFQKAVHWK